MGYIVCKVMKMLDLTESLGMKTRSEPWGGADSIPYFLNETYDFQKVDLDGTQCIFAVPRGEIPAVQAIAKHFFTIYATASMPIVLRLNGLSGERRKALMTARVPFVATDQIYLPFMGTVLQERLYEEPATREKLMPSAQLLLFAYLYQDSGKMFTSPMAELVGVSAMQITRAVRQLQRLNLFDVSKEGVQVVIEGKANHRALFEGAAKYLLDPVREILYIPRSESSRDLPFAGLSALSEMTMLAASEVPTFAYFSRTDKLTGENGLTDRDKQARVEVWKYAPTTLSKKANTADPLSVIVSLKSERYDERIEQAIEDILKKIWV